MVFKMLKMKKIIIISLLLAFCGTMQAQFRAPLKTKRNKNDRSNVVSVGIKGGVTWPSMDFTDPNLSDLPRVPLYDTLFLFQQQQTDTTGTARVSYKDTLLYSFKPIFGVFVDVPIGEHISIAPEIMYVKRGMHTGYYNRDSLYTDYSIRSRGIDLRVPLVFSFKLGSVVQPYVFAAPDFGLVLGGTIRQIMEAESSTTVDTTTLAIDAGNMNLFHFSVLGGVGVRFNFNFNKFSMLMKVEAGYNYGVLDTFSKMEHDDLAAPVNVNAYNTTGKRLTRGLECCVSIGIPLKFAEKDACSNFKDIYEYQ